MKEKGEKQPAWALLLSLLKGLGEVTGRRGRGHGMSLSTHKQLAERQEAARHGYISGKDTGPQKNTLIGDFRITLETPAGFTLC